MSYTQRIVSFEDWEKYQANFIEVVPARPLLKGDSSKLVIEYEGYLFGYTETGMGYVRDRIDPELGYPSEKVNRVAGVLFCRFAVNDVGPPCVQQRPLTILKGTVYLFH